MKGNETYGIWLDNAGLDVWAQSDLFEIKTSLTMDLNTILKSDEWGSFAAHNIALKVTLKSE